MRAYYDTSVLLPTPIQEHELHTACIDLRREAVTNGVAITGATHAYAELYRHLTKNVRPYDLLPEDAFTAIIDQLGHRMETITTDREDYEAALARCRTEG